MSERSFGRLACLAALPILLACWEPTGPGGIQTVTLHLPGALDLDAGSVDSIPGPGRGNEVELYLRSGAPWFASVPGIPIALLDTAPPTISRCRAPTLTWSYFESPVASMSSPKHFCLTTSDSAVGWVTVERIAGSDSTLLITYEAAH